MASKKRKKRKGKKGRNNGLRPYLPIIGLVVAGLLVGGAFFAWASTRPDTGETQAATCVLVIDRTPSADNPQTVDRYRNLAYKTVDGCAEKRGSLGIYSFDPVSQKLALANDQVFDLWQPLGPKEAANKIKQEQNIEDAKAAVDLVFEQPANSASGSNILSALSDASENLNNQATADNVPDRYLVMLTDGLQISPDASVESLNTEASEVPPLVEKAAALGLVPSALKGADVSFVGVRSGVTAQGAALPNWFEAKVEDFWRQVVGRGGGNVCTYVVDSQVLPVGC